ncbi:hypothetical protein MTO96_023284 [Rhipicephalus appendiculatus]
MYPPPAYRSRGACARSPRDKTLRDGRHRLSSSARQSPAAEIWSVSPLDSTGLWHRAVAGQVWQALLPSAPHVPCLP